MILLVAALFVVVVAAALFWVLRGTEGEYKSQTFYFKDGDQKVAFPPISAAPTLYLSIVVPAYNEEKRIFKMLDETLEYCAERQRREPDFTYEIVVVDDGSKDKTSQVVLDNYRNISTDILRVNTLVKNVGKGGAVRRGVLCSRGRYILMADADGATLFSDLEKLEQKMPQLEAEGQGIVVGSRAAYQQHEKDSVQRAWYRNITQVGFHVLVDTLCVRGIKDTQCGFKLFTRAAAQRLFFNLHIERWAFDVELLYLAQKLRVPIGEVGVNWQEIDGSHLSVMAASLQMFKDIVRVPLLYTLGFWRVRKVD